MIRSTAFLLPGCLAAALALAPAPVHAQTNANLGSGLGNITADPFLFYYAFYLPNQQIQSMRPMPSDTINQAVINRQYYAQTQRQSLYNPISPYAEEYDPLRPYTQKQGGERIAQALSLQSKRILQHRRLGSTTLLQPRLAVLHWLEDRARA